jgi:hypothetical protein
VLLIGDSTAMALSEGLLGWADGRPAQVQVASLARPGCGLLHTSRMSGVQGERIARGCVEAFDGELPSVLDAQPPDVVVVMVTLPDVIERMWADDEGLLRSNDPRYVDRRRAEYADFADTLRAAGVSQVVWVVPPRPTERWLQSAVNPVRDDEWAAFVAAIQEVAAREPAGKRVVRLDEWMRAIEPPDGSMRPDGLHLTPAAATVVMDRFIGPLLLSTAGR